VFDPVGGEFTKAALRCIAPEGRLLVIGFAGGAIPQIPANILLVKNISAMGIYWGTYLGFGRVQPKDFTEVTRAFRDMMQFWGDGRLRPRIDSRFPLARAADALDRLANRQAIGKVVLEVATSPA
jgi:NADPH:quinone reductase